jgi:type I restriction enzyme R subunit
LLEAARQTGDNLVAGSLGIETEHFDYPPFAQRGGLGGAYQALAEGLEPLLAELNRVFAA